ncbi:hypothetical protein [Emticicia sp. BO119]|uniref:hypothetical protein n=1 Tax=Emticicia sp. BO119 TaxID=2757768 RepID=UPI0015F0CEDE|nr:hypothetical protein [Emticicia sp. BO119]MBA4851055.1 hypothetical protein [Emticicia sp. BO119]
MKKIFTFFVTCLIASSYVIAQHSEALPGTLKATTLSGVGKRPVYSDPDGVLINQSSGDELYISIPAADFGSTTDQGPINFNFGEVAGNGGTNMRLIAPAGYLPYRVKINKMRVCFKDNIISNLEVSLFEVYPDPSLTALTTTTLATAVSAGADPKYRCIDKEVEKVFDYAKFSYYLQARPVPNQTDNGIWSSKIEDMSLVHVILFYAYL